MELQYWLYIIIGIIYLLNQFRKKPEQQTDVPETKPDRSVRNYGQPDVKPRPQQSVTFEELLREIAEVKQTQQGAKPEEASTHYVDYDDDLQEEGQSLEDVNYDYRTRDVAYQEYQDAKRLAFERPSLEETMKLEDTPMSYGRFKEFEVRQQRDVVGEFLSDLKDPEGLKKAIVISEILKRKF